jgi:hypothetical protein
VNLTGALNQVADAAGVSVEVRSAHGPWFGLSPEVPGASAAPDPSTGAVSGPPFSLKGWFIRWLKPQVIVRSDFGTWSRAPGGEPEATTWPFVPLVAGGVLLLLVVLA